MTTELDGLFEAVFQLCDEVKALRLEVAEIRRKGLKVNIPI
jgi:hypothetical protein